MENYPCVPLLIWNTDLMVRDDTEHPCVPLLIWNTNLMVRDDTEQILLVCSTGRRYNIFIVGTKSFMRMSD